MQWWANGYHLAATKKELPHNYHIYDSYEGVLLGWQDSNLRMPETYQSFHSNLFLFKKACFSRLLKHTLLWFNTPIQNWRVKIVLKFEV